jgi:hypothetical protein
MREKDKERKGAKGEGNEPKPSHPPWRQDARSPPPHQQDARSPPHTWRKGGVSVTGDSRRGKGRGAAKNTANDPADPRCKRGDVHSTVGHKCTDISSDTPVCERSRTQKSSCLYPDLRSGHREQE